ncbi:OLC1v1034971C1 [Oldenlandia corymbosa var. corymbosa]|uniref:OLC1v1034971C1 n=1 Tax=Oldenlandia corymbosa var. corymbosa TaxID=529605 RepID=A0AAV1CUZ1_OLDCO|nr:OLC1v1034971C1 [Oldenlandia corymbosa var. corymbosa]
MELSPSFWMIKTEHCSKMASLLPMYDARHRTNFGYEPHYPIYGEDQTEDHHDYYNKNHQNHIPILSGNSPYSVHPPSYHHRNNHFSSSSPPVRLDDAAIEWKDTPEAHIFKTVLPVGVRREDVKVQLEDDRILRISAERVSETGDRRKNWRHVEFSGPKFMTAVTLPEDARADLIKSSWENGVLTVRIPRRDMGRNYRHRVRNVDISDH